MKMLKKGLLILTAFVFIFAFTSCGCSSQEEAKTKDGAVIYCEAGELCMVTSASEVLTFDVENAEIDSVDAIGYGDLAEVEYTGEITDGDTSEVTVTKVTAVPSDIFEEEADKVSNNTTKKAAKVTIAAVSDTVYVTADDVAVRSSYDVKAKRIGTVNKGKKLTRTGKTSNGWSRIKYDGKDAYVINKYLKTKAPKKPKKTTAKKTEKKTTAAQKTTSMDGTVKEVVNNKLTITTETSNEYTFNIKGVAYDVVLDPGTEITVVFKGTEDKPGKVISITAR